MLQKIQEKQTSNADHQHAELRELFCLRNQAVFFLF